MPVPLRIIGSLMFEALRTERLLLRPPRIGDAEALAERRSDPGVASLQSWEVPFSLDKARRLVAGAAERGGPVPGEWWQLTIADPEDAVIFGDLALHLQWGGRMAEIGYTLGRTHWGNGYATEAVEALLCWLFEEQGVTRVEALLHPENLASASVLERTGFVFEAHKRLSFWVGDDNSDDWVYAMTESDWRAWRSRPRSEPEKVELVEVTEANVREVGRLATHKSQEGLVAPMYASFADALFPEVIDGAPVVPWMRGVKADGEWAGFVMVAAVTEAHPEPYLWRLLVDRRHQRRGIGRRILDLVVEDQQSSGATALMTSWDEGHGSPRPFYLRYGFVETGEFPDGETEARLVFE